MGLDHFNTKPSSHNDRRVVSANPLLHEVISTRVDVSKEPFKFQLKDKPIDLNYPPRTTDSFEVNYLLKLVTSPPSNDGSRGYEDKTQVVEVDLSYPIAIISK